MPTVVYGLIQERVSLADEKDQFSARNSACVSYF
jgi:hypothetical protein